MAQQILITGPKPIKIEQIQVECYSDILQKINELTNFWSVKSKVLNVTTRFEFEHNLPSTLRIETDSKIYWYLCEVIAPQPSNEKAKAESEPINEPIDFITDDIHEPTHVLEDML